MNKLIGKGWLRAILLVFVMAGSAPANAVNTLDNDDPSAAYMFTDFVLLRPLGLVSAVLGTATFIVTSPFSLLGGNIVEAGSNLVVDPWAYTFFRPLGDI